MQDSVNKDREKYIGGSDIPIIMNLSPFKSRFDLLLEKAGYKKDEFEGNIYTEYGNTLEPIIRDFINSGIKDPFTEGKHIREADADEIIGTRIHTDGENKDTILEIKTTGTATDNIEDYKLYLVQLVYYMYLTGKTYGLLAVYERPENLSTELDAKRLHLFNIARGEDFIESLIAEISEAIEHFIEDLAKVKENPFITEAELLPVEIPDITNKILALESQLNYYKNVEATIKAEKERLRQAMIKAMIPSFTTPNGTKVTLVKDADDTLKESTELDIDLLKKDKPELFKPVAEGGYMVTKQTIQKGKKGYILITPPKDKKGG